jgi:hypothetical protein
VVHGPTAIVPGDLVEDNRNEAEIAVWIGKHNRYAVLQAVDEETRWASDDAPRGRVGGTPDERTLWMKATWNRMPLFIRPFGYFLYRYVIRLGFLDGKEGFIFHFLQAFWYRLLVDINRDERRARMSAGAPSPAPMLRTPALPGRPMDPGGRPSEKKT